MSTNVLRCGFGENAGGTGWISSSFEKASSNLFSIHLISDTEMEQYWFNPIHRKKKNPRCKCLSCFVLGFNLLMDAISLLFTENAEFL